MSVNAPAPNNPELVIRKLDENTITCSVPFTRAGFLPIGGRSTFVKLQDRSIWMLASHALDPQTMETISMLAGDGPGVQHIVVADREHSMFTSHYVKAFPQAKLYVPEGAKANWAKKGSGKEDLIPHITHVFDGKSADPFEATTGGEIKSIDFGKSHNNEDVAFLHAPTKTLIQADLMFHLPPTEQYSKSTKRATLPFLSHALTAYSANHKRMLWYGISKDRAMMAERARQVAAWDFDRIIPCHGDVIETGGKGAWNELYKQFLEYKK